MGFRVYVTVVVGGLLHFEPLMLTGFPKLTFREVVFLLPLWHVGAWVLQGGLLVSTRGSQKVTVLAVFLVPAMLFTWDVAARVGSLKVIIPSLSDVT